MGFIGSKAILMKKFTLTLLLGIFLGGLSNAQDLKLTGTVVDSLGLPLPMANVIAYQKDKNLGAFGITNNSGKFQLLSLKKDSTYVVKVSYLGLKTFEDTIRNMQTDLERTYVLTEDANQLDAVNLVYEMPVTIKGDTIVYNSDSFTNGTERKLGEVLQKLPGVEVNADGDVEVEGQRVEKLMVNGKDFFEGDTRLGTKNIPANAVDKVEVLKNYNNVSQLKGLGNDQDRIAINIRLKEGKTNFWFGEGQGGVGYGGQEERYLLQPKAFYYSEKFSMNILTDLNNIGVPAFTSRDYFRFVGFNFSNTIGSGVNVATGANNGLNLNVGNVTDIETRFGAINTSYSVNDKLDLKAFAIVSHNDTRARTESRNIFTTGLNEFRRIEEEESATAMLFKLGADYKPNGNFSLDYDGQINLTDQLGSNIQISERTGGSNAGIEDIQNLNDQNPITYNQNLNLYYTLSDDDIFSFEGRFINQEEDPFLNAIRDIRNVDEPDPFDNLGIVNDEPYNLNQSNLVTTNRVDAKLDYWRVLNKKSNINFTAGILASSQDYNSNIFQRLTNGGVNELNPSTDNNDVNYDFTNYFIGARYKFITGKFTFTPGIAGHIFRTEDRQNGITNSIESQQLLPELNIRYDFRSSQSLNLDYRQNVRFNDINSYAQGLVLRSFNSLSRGNNQLEGQTTDQISLVYRDFNMFAYQTITGRLSYSRVRDGIQSRVNIDGINQASVDFNTDLPIETLSASGGYSREISKVQATVRATLNFSQFSNEFNNVITKSQNLTQLYSIEGRSNFQDGVNFFLRYGLNLNDGQNGSFENNSTTHTIASQIDWQIGKRWFVRADYNYNIFQATGGIENDFDLLDATIRYNKPGSKWEYSLIGSNLLDLEARESNNFTQILTSTNSTFILPRIIYFQVRYDL
jgi:hypothetical protein